MKRLRIFAAVTLFLCFRVYSAHASTIILSGDTNIVALSGSLQNPGNERFFTNILQGGSSVVVLQSSLSVLLGTGTQVNNFYNTLPGVTSILISGSVTAPQLSGVNLFVSPVPDDPFDPTEIAALSGLLGTGGTILFLGDNSQPLFAPANAAINAALFDLSSSLRILPDSSIGAGNQTATGAQIAADPFTAGVTSLNWGGSSQVSGGTQLFFGQAAPVQPFVTYETNQTAVIPEPSTFALLALGMVCLAASRRKKV